MVPLEIVLILIFTYTLKGVEINYHILHIVDIISIYVIF